LICTHSGESHRAHFLIMVRLKAKANPNWHRWWKFAISEADTHIYDDKVSRMAPFFS